MNITKISPGYPCHKYILRNINSEKDLWSYAKAFVSTAVQNGIQHELAMSMLSVSLSNLPHESGLICPDFAHIGTTPKDSCLMLMSYIGIPAFKSCNAFYKKYDSKTPCCRICPISNIFYNGNKSIELSIIKYMFLSEENFNFVTNYIDASFFRSAIDVCMEIPYIKACIVPILSEIVKSSLKQNIRILLFDEKSQLYFNNSDISAFDIAWEDMISWMPRERRVPSIVKNNPMWESVLRKTISKQIHSATDLSTKKIRDILFEYLQVSKESAFESLSNRSAQSSMIYCLDICKTDTPSMHEKKTDFFSEELFSKKETNHTPCLFASSLGKTLSNNISFTSNLEIMKAYETIPSPISTSKIITNADISSTSLLPITHSQSLGEKSSTITPNGINMKRDMIIHICIPKENIEPWCICLKKTDKLSDGAYQKILRDKHMYIELIMISEKKCFQYSYLIYSAYEKKFYLSNCQDASEQVIALLSRQAVKKICHTPYLLYGISALCHRQIRNVMSIQTVHTRISGKIEVMNYENLINSYLSNKKNPTLSFRTDPDCIFYHGMPFYEEIARTMENMINHYSKPILYEMDLCVDEAIGYSFFYERNFNDSGFLAMLLPNGSFLYHDGFQKSPKTSGYYVSYVIKNHTSSAGFFRHILYRLSYDGNMRKHNIQLIGLHGNMINFFIAKECFEYLTTLINLYAFEYGELYLKNKMVIEQLIEQTDRHRSSV